MTETIWQQEQAAFYKDCEKAAELSRENLKRLMEDNQDTVYGKAHSFEKVKTPEDYKEYVPVTDYADYEDFVRRMEAGEEKVLTAYEVKHYIMTSGSTGSQKRIPITTESLKRCIRLLYYTSYACVPGIEEAKILHMSVFRMELPKVERDTILSVAYFGALHDEGGCELNERYLGGEALLFEKGIGNVPYVKAWIALLSPEMTGIQSIFMYDILVFFRYFEENWEQILKDVRERHIPKELPLSDSAREALLALPAASKEWLEKVESECRRGFSGIGKRLWKHLSFASGISGSTFFVQEAALRRYLGDVPLHYFAYAASECMMGITTELESMENILMPRSGYFEFLPYINGEESDVRQAKTMEELEVGERYEILLTNFSGLYRYRLNDVVEVTGFCGQAPKLKVGFRKNQAINIAGEKMDLQLLSRGVEELAKKYGLCLYEYSVMDDKSLLPGRYQCFLEAGEIKGRADMEKLLGLDEAFDDILGGLNEDYQDLRRLGLIGVPRVFGVVPGSHNDCKKRFGKKQAQNKPLQYLIDPEVIGFMKERIL